MAFQAQKIDDCIGVNIENGKKIFYCKICRKQLSSKQRVENHLQLIHNKAPAAKKTKLYQFDRSIPVPRRTLYRQRYENLDNCAESSSDNVIDEESYHTEENDTENNENESVTADVCSAEESIVESDNLTQPTALFDSSNDEDVSSESSDEAYSSDSSSSSSNSIISSDSENETVNKFDDKESQSILLLQYIMRHNLNRKASKDMLSLIHTLVENNSPFAEITINDIYNLVGKSEFLVYHYCGNCGNPFPLDDETQYSCSTNSCNGLRYVGSLEQQHVNKKPRNTFIIGDIDLMLKTMLQKPGMLEKLIARKKSASNFVRNQDSNVSDIIYSQCYQELLKPGGFLTGDYNFSAQFNTDGVKLRKSSGIKLWPIYIAINELPVNIRFYRENLILVGLWQGKSQPPYFHYTAKFCEIANELYHEGISMDYNGTQINFKLGVLLGTMDLPAKCKILNMSQFNGFYGCATCEEPGKREKKGKGSVQTYPYRQANDRFPERISDDIVKNKAPNACANNRNVGIIGFSPLIYMKWFDLVKGIVPDYMHGALLGTTKTLMYLWFSPTNSAMPFFVGKKIKKISKRMNSIQPPHCVDRLPKDLELNFNSFKASEYQIFLLYYGVPCLYGILAEQYLSHFALLSEAIYILLNDVITDYELDRATFLCDKFYSDFSNLYGIENCGLNVHNIGSHLVNYVRMWGSVAEWSNFGYEDENGHLIKGASGTGDVTRELFRMKISDSTIRSISKDQLANKKYVSVIGILRDKGKIWKNVILVNNCYIVKALRKLRAAETSNLMLIECGAESYNDIKVLGRVELLSKRKVYSKEYVRMKRHISYVVLLQSGLIVEVQKFLFNLKTDIVYADVIYYKLLDDCYYFNDLPRHLLRIEITPERRIINVIEIKEVLFFVRWSDTACTICRMPNIYGHGVLK